MRDATWGVMLLTAALWVVGPVWRWRNIRRRARLIPRLWRSLHRAPQPAKTAEINAGLEHVEQPAPVDLAAAGEPLDGRLMPAERSPATIAARVG